MYNVWNNIFAQKNFYLKLSTRMKFQCFLEFIQAFFIKFNIHFWIRIIASGPSRQPASEHVNILSRPPASEHVNILSRPPASEHVNILSRQPASEHVNILSEELILLI